MGQSEKLPTWCHMTVVLGTGTSPFNVCHLYAKGGVLQSWCHTVVLLFVASVTFSGVSKPLTQVQRLLKSHKPVVLFQKEGR